MYSCNASSAEAGPGEKSREMPATREATDEQLLAGMDPSHLWQQIADITVKGALNDVTSSCLIQQHRPLSKFTIFV